MAQVLAEQCPGTHFTEKDISETKSTHTYTSAFSQLSGLNNHSLRNVTQYRFYICKKKKKKKSKTWGSCQRNSINYFNPASQLWSCCFSLYCDLKGKIVGIQNNCSNKWSHLKPSAWTLIILKPWRTTLYFLLAFSEIKMNYFNGSLPVQVQIISVDHNQSDQSEVFSTWRCTVSSGGYFHAAAQC